MNYKHQVIVDHFYSTNNIYLLGLILILSCIISNNNLCTNASEAINDEIYYVMEPFDEVSDKWSIRIHNNEGKLNLTKETVSPPLFNEGDVVRVEYEVIKSENWGGFVDFGWVLENRTHNCHGATHISLWYKIIKPQTLPNSVHLRLNILDDSHCALGNPGCGDKVGQDLEVYTSFNHILDDTSEDWKEIKIKLEGDGNSDSPFWRPGWMGQVGNDELDAERLRGWRIEFAIDTEDDIGVSSNGVLLLDQLQCVGGGELLGAAFYPVRLPVYDENDENSISLLEQSLIEGLWYEKDSQSDLSRNLTETNLTLDGMFSMNYSMNRGSFLYYEHIAPGNAYYNLSQSSNISLSYDVPVAALPPGYADLQIILMDGSDCTKNCDVYPGDQNLKKYSFNFDSILDNYSTYPWSDSLIIDFKNYSSSDNGNDILHESYIKGYRFKLNFANNNDEMNEDVSGIFSFKNFRALLQNSNMMEQDSNNKCVYEPGVDFITDDGLTKYRKIQFAGAKCCEICEADPDCLYAADVRREDDGRDCYMTSYLHPNSVGLSNTEYKKENIISIWMNSDKKRGDFCNICSCDETKKKIDCRGRDLVIIPKTFLLTSWKPLILDLSNNPRLVIIGSGSLDAISDELQELRLPSNVKYMTPFATLKALTVVIFEEDYQLNNVISDQSGFFSDVCCDLGEHIDLKSPSYGLSFCNMQIYTPGTDSVYEPFWEYMEAETLISLRSDSKFMAEAAENPSKCAEYCTFTEECNYFSYKALWMNAEHTCNLLKNNGTPSFVCCKQDDYGDEEMTIAGWTSGRPPRTRYYNDNATVLVTEQSLDLDKDNNFKAQYQIRLGSTPLRGAVWIEPIIASNTNLDVIISPTRAVLYDDAMVATITIELLNTIPVSSSETIVILNNIESCDSAFAKSKSETTVYMNVKYQSDSQQMILTIAIIVPLAIVCIMAAVYLYTNHKKRLADTVWSIKVSELKFDDPPEIIGRGTFGLVLLAEYRGTPVAVKRVLPARAGNKDSNFGTGSTTLSDRMHHSTRLHSGSTIDFLSSLDSKDSILVNNPTSNGNGKAERRNSLDMLRHNSLDMVNNFRSSVLGKSSSKLGTTAISHHRDSVQASYTSLKHDFVREMRHLSKLRHPCITTVMGAIIDKKEEPMLVMEYMVHGSLYDLLHNKTVIEVEGEQILPILRDVAHGIRFLHAANPQVIHGDLKAQNILVDNKFRAKVADFGLSQKKQVGATGTPYWMAPELLRKEHPNSAASDVYSFGIILYEVYSRREPYEGEDFTTVLRGVINPSVNKRPPVPSSCPKEIQSIMSKCLLDDRTKRPTFEEIDEWLKKLDAATVEPGKNRLSKQEKKEKELTDNLLHDVFPEHIAKSLRFGKKVEPETRDIVTIFFSDIVGFTNISSSLTPIKISLMLDRLYNEFDSLSHEYDVFKVETIGDAYMAVCNLVKDQNDHTTRIAEFSVKAVKAANATLIDTDNPDLGYVNIRVGFHSGPVVANVVGSRNPRYCLFGDTVNTASRMESNSEKNRIHCSKRAAILLRKQNSDIGIRSRGTIQVKGKGEMETYWVTES